MVATSRFKRFGGSKRDPFNQPYIILHLANIKAWLIISEMVMHSIKDKPDDDDINNTEYVWYLKDKH